MYRLIMVVVACALLSSPAMGEVINFDNGTPGLSVGQNAPFDQTVAGLTAHFSPPGGVGKYSIQTGASAGLTLSQFSGHFLYPNTSNRDHLHIKFTQPLASITFNFATTDFPPIEIPTPIQLTAYLNSTANPAVGSTTAKGTYGSDTLPMGTLTFSSAQPFDLVEIVIQAGGGGGFLLDNIAVTTVVPEPHAFALLGTGLLALAVLGRRRRD